MSVCVYAGVSLTQTLWVWFFNEKLSSQGEHSELLRVLPFVFPSFLFPQIRQALHSHRCGVFRVISGIKV